MTDVPLMEKERVSRSIVSGKLMMAFAIVAVVAIGCFVLMDADDSDAETSGSCGENLTWSIDGEGNLTITGTGAMTDYESWDTRWGGNTVTAVSLPADLTSIGNNAFYGCSSLASVTIGDSVTSIGSAAFRGCTSLASVTIGDSVTSIGAYAFYGCNSLASVTIPDSVTTIGSAAFAVCTSLSSITIPNSVTTIGESAFYGCTSLAEVNVSCTNPLGITKGTEGNGYIAYYATTVNLIHAYSATYGWADDGSSCTVHIVCANNAAHNHDIVAQVASSVKIQPTATTNGTTEYSVSGTYDGFAYSDAKDVQDIPATGGSDSGNSDSNKKEFPIIYVAIGIVAVLALAILLIRRH